MSIAAKCLTKIFLDELKFVEEQGRWNPVGVTKRLMAGLSALAARSMTDYDVIEIREVSAPSGYSDYDTVVRYRATSGSSLLGSDRAVELLTSLVVHTSGTGRDSVGALHASTAPTRIWVSSRGNPEEVTEFILPPLAERRVWEAPELQGVKSLIEKINSRFVLDLAMRQVKTMKGNT